MVARPGIRSRVLLRTLFGIALLALGPTAAHAVKTDTLTLRNGDRVTGEVKSMTRGKLKYGTDDMGTLSIEWVKIARLTSPHMFQVEVASGERFHGPLGAVARDGLMAVQEQPPDTLAIPGIVRIDPLDSGILQRVTAYLDLGLSYAKANQATTFNTSGQIEHRADKFGSKLSFDTYVQGQENVPTTTRGSTTYQLSRFLPNRWNVAAMTKLEQNDELNLTARLTFSGGLFRVVSQSNSSVLTTGGGLAFTGERFSSTDEAGAERQTSLEGLLVADWDAFRFDSPKLDFSTSLYLYPSISDAGRVRGEYSLRVTYELFSDFNVGLSGTDTFDSHPPQAGASKNDYIMSFTIGWSYRR